jgi:hypothetical protein
MLFAVVVTASTLFASARYAAQTPAQPPAGLVTPNPQLEELRRDIANGMFVPRNSLLTICFPQDVVAFSEERKSLGPTWAGRFVLEGAATGAWHLEVIALDTELRWRAALNVPVGTTIESDPLRSARVTIRLIGPGGAGQQCPLVRLVGELQEQVPSKPRGLVGQDDRWALGHPTLHQQKDVAVLLTWGNAVVHLQVVSRTGLLLPCSAFFVTPNVFMTAAHCIGSVEEAQKAIVHLPDRLVTGNDLKLLMADGELDFALVRATGANAPTTLSLGGLPGPSLVLWQFPSSNARLISVVNCAGTRTGQTALLTHRCDSTGGSSGSPIQARDDGKVVGLHTSGCAQGNGTNNCVNGGSIADGIRANILKVEVPLRQWDPVGAEELLAALKSSQ